MDWERSHYWACGQTIIKNLFLRIVPYVTTFICAITLYFPNKREQTVAKLGIPKSEKIQELIQLY